MVILPLTYMGSIQWFSLLAQRDCLIDIHENYVKQTCRNRCEILTASGMMPLTVNVVKGGSWRKKEVCSVGIDYSKRWQHGHWISIMSAYRGSPYFEHYAPRLAPFYSERVELLADLNIGLLKVLLQVLGMEDRLRISSSYVQAGPDDTDLRGTDFLSAHGLGTQCPEYCQVFSDRLPFQGGLSVLDLLMCEGPCAKELLRSHPIPRM